MVNLASNSEESSAGKKTKTCTTCQAVNPLEAYYPSDRGKLGRDSICKECRKAKRRRAYKQERSKSTSKNKTRTPQRRRQCLRCSKHRWASAFYPHRHRPDRLTQLCQTCHVEISGQDVKNEAQAGQKHISQERLGDYHRQETGAKGPQAVQCPPILRDARSGKDRPMDSVPPSQIQERKVAA